jgi:hypothetical protein
MYTIFFFFFFFFFFFLAREKNNNKINIKTANPRTGACVEPRKKQANKTHDEKRAQKAQKSRAYINFDDLLT